MIFTYHRVLPYADELLPGSPTVDRFERQLQWIRKYCNPLALSEAVDRLVGNDLPPRAAAVTFDDGYANNLGAAAPLLKKYEIPAIVFVAVDALERGIMWNDLVVEAVRRAGSEIDASAVGLGKLQLNGSKKLGVLNRLLQCLKYRSVEERMELSLLIYSNTSSEAVPRQMLKPTDLNKLASFGIEIGAHTVNHPILRILDDEQARAEVENSRSWLQRQTGVEPTLFAYPNGRRGDDYDERHMEMVKELGFRAAVSTNWGCATSQDSLYELPRFRPWENTEFGFYTRLCKVAIQSYL